MYLPQSVLALIQTLAQAGFEAWAVGGCVRDALLGIQPHDYDLCTNARPEQLQEVFAGRRLVTAGIRHGTVGVVTDTGVVEITTFRTEGGYADSRHPDWVAFVSDIHQDLARRDFTVNAMAYNPEKGYADPFGGREDLSSGILRCVGDPAARFTEDALRILRGLRFAARFDLTIEENTWLAMCRCVPELDTLSRERVFDEVQKFLCLTDEARLIQAAAMMVRVIPELGACVGFCQHSPHHAYDVFTHTAHVLAGVPGEPVLRLAALLHDIGKPGCFTTDETGRGHFYGHAQRSAQMAEEILLRLRSPRQLREDVVWLIGHHMNSYPPEPKTLRRCLSRYGLRQMERLLLLQRADLAGKGAEPVDEGLNTIDRTLALLRRIAQEEACLSLKQLAVSGRDLIALGYAPGPELGNTLKTLLEKVLTEEVPNEKDALLASLPPQK